MFQNLPEVIKKTAKFLEKPITDKQLKKLTNHLSFDSMKSNPAINGEEFIKDVIIKYDMPRDDPELTFIRKGMLLFLSYFFPAKPYLGEVNVRSWLQG